MNYFPKSETSCKCGCGLDIKDEIRAMLNVARSACGFPIRVNSGARCVEHNKTVGSKATKSDHIFGQGVDILPQSAKHKYIMMKELMNAGFDRIIVYLDKDIIHAAKSGPNPGPMFLVKKD